MSQAEKEKKLKQNTKINFKNNPDLGLGPCSTDSPWSPLFRIRSVPFSSSLADQTAMVELVNSLVSGIYSAVGFGKGGRTFRLPNSFNARFGSEALISSD